MKQLIEQLIENEELILMTLQEAQQPRPGQFVAVMTDPDGDVGMIGLTGDWRDRLPEDEENMVPGVEFYELVLKEND